MHTRVVVALGLGILALGASGLASCASNGSGGAGEGPGQDAGLAHEGSVGDGTAPGDSTMSLGDSTMSPGDSTIGPDTAAPPADGAPPEDSAPQTDAIPPSDGSSPESATPMDAAPPFYAPIYAHSPTALYTLDTSTHVLALVGNFSCLTQAGDAVVDLAVDRTGAVYGTSFLSFFVVDDPATAHCTTIQTIGGMDGGAFTTYPNALSFIATPDGGTEMLVGYILDQYVQINRTTGAMTVLGALNPNSFGKNLYSSGDIVSVVGAPTYLTAVVQDDAGNVVDSGGDLLVVVNPQTGAPIKIVGATGYTQLYGLGYWAGVGYGFSGNGQIIAIDLGDAASTLLDASTGPDAFYGAGVTTIAPTQ